MRVSSRIIATLACVLIVAPARAFASESPTNTQLSGSGSLANGTLSSSNATLSDVFAALSETLEDMRASVNVSDASEAYASALREMAALADGSGAAEAAEAASRGDMEAAVRALERGLESMVNETMSNASTSASASVDDANDASDEGDEEDDEDEDEEADAEDFETYLLDTSTPEKSKTRVKRVEPLVADDSDDVEAIGVVLADVGRAYGESPVARTLARFAARKKVAILRPGTCAGTPLTCSGACSLSEASVSSQLAALGASAQLGGGATSGDRAGWMSKVAGKDSRWIGEVGHPVNFAFERMYRAVRHYITSGDAELAPVPELEQCAEFTKTLAALKEKCASMRCKTGFSDMQKYISTAQKKEIFTCPGFTANPQTKRLRGGSVDATESPSSAERRTRAKYAALVPISSSQSEQEYLVALTYSFDFKLTDLLSRTPATDEAYDVSNEPEELRRALKEKNEIDLKLFESVSARMEDAKTQSTFAARLGALQAMSAAADIFCSDNRVCTAGRAATTTIDFDPAHVSTLGTFPASCGTEAVAKEFKCVEDWFLCEGPGATGSVWHSTTGETSSTSTPAAAPVGQQETVSTTTAPPPPPTAKTASNVTTAETTTAKTGEKSTNTSIDTAQASEKGSEKPVSDSEKSGEKPVSESDDSDVTARPSVAGSTFRAAVRVHRNSPWLWYSISFIMVAVALTSFVHARLEAATNERPASSLELGASIVRAEREVSAKEIGREMMTNDDFWKNSRSSSPPRDAGRGTGLDRGTAGRRPGRGRRAAAVRGPMTAEERAFYDEL